MKLFDLDGTLMDSNGVWVQVDLDFLAKRGLAVTEEYSDFVSHSIFPLAAQYTKEYYGLSETPDEIMAEWLAAAEDAYAHHIPMKPYVRSYLDQCRNRGEELALVPQLCRACLDRHGLTPYFSHLVFAQELGVEKRDPRAFLHAAQAVGETPEQCTVFDDAPANCVSAKAAGMRVVGVYDIFFAHAEAEMRRTCDRYILSFQELVD